EQRSRVPLIRVFYVGPLRIHDHRHAGGVPLDQSHGAHERSDTRGAEGLIEGGVQLVGTGDVTRRLHDRGVEVLHPRRVVMTRSARSRNPSYIAVETDAEHLVLPPPRTDRLAEVPI